MYIRWRRNCADFIFHISGTWRCSEFVCGCSVWHARRNLCANPRRRKWRQNACPRRPRPEQGPAAPWDPPPVLAPCRSASVSLRHTPRASAVWTCGSLGKRLLLTNSVLPTERQVSTVTPWPQISRCGTWESQNRHRFTYTVLIPNFPIQIGTRSSPIPHEGDTYSNFQLLSIIYSSHGDQWLLFQSNVTASIPCRS